MARGAAVPACSPARPPRHHHSRPCRSLPDVCSGKKSSTKLAKTILRAAGKVQRAGSALAHWGMPVPPMETQLPGWEALQVPAGRGGSSPPAAPVREGGWRVPGSCLWPLTKRQGCQRALMVRIQSLQHGNPDQPCTEAEPGFNHHSDKWETFCYVCASVL